MTITVLLVCVKCFQCNWGMCICITYIIMLPAIIILATLITYIQFLHFLLDFCDFFMKVADRIPWLVFNHIHQQSLHGGESVQSDMLLISYLENFFELYF